MNHPQRRPCMSQNVGGRLRAVAIFCTASASFGHTSGTVGGAPVYVTVFSPVALRSPT